MVSKKDKLSNNIGRSNVVVKRATKLANEHNRREKKYKHVLIQLNNRTWVERRKSDKRPINKDLIESLKDSTYLDRKYKRR